MPPRVVSGPCPGTVLQHVTLFLKVRVRVRVGGALLAMRCHGAPGLRRVSLARMCVAPNTPTCACLLLLPTVRLRTGTLHEPVYTGPRAKEYPFVLDPFQETSVACLVGLGWRQQQQARRRQRRQQQRGGEARGGEARGWEDTLG